MYSDDGSQCSAVWANHYSVSPNSTVESSSLTNCSFRFPWCRVRTIKAIRIRNPANEQEVCSNQPNVGRAATILYSLLNGRCTYLRSVFMSAWFHADEASGLAYITYVPVHDVFVARYLRGLVVRGENQVTTVVHVSYVFGCICAFSVAAGVRWINGFNIGCVSIWRRKVRTSRSTTTEAPIADSSRMPRHVATSAIRAR